jgi:hypothetical protein
MEVFEVFVFADFASRLPAKSLFPFVSYSAHTDNSENSAQNGQQKLEQFYDAQKERGKASKDVTIQKTRHEFYELTRINNRFRPT